MEIGHMGNVQAGDNVTILFGDEEGQDGTVTVVRHEGRRKLLVVKLASGKSITATTNQVSIK